MTGIEIVGWGFASAAAEIATYAVIASSISAYATYQQGKSAQEQAKAQSAWHAYNAQVARREATAEREAAAFEAKQQKRKGRQLLARQASLIGASGVTPAGSPLLVMEDTAAQLTLENINIRKRGSRRAAAFESQSILDISKASTAKSRASAFGRAKYTEAGASILSGAVQTGVMGYQMDLWGN